jgi:translation initiation factor IF-2
MKGMLDPEFKEKIIGQAEIRQTFKVSKVGTIAGSYVTDGKITRDSGIRLIRNGVVTFEGNIDALKRFKDDVKEVAQGYECGITIKNFNDVKEGDIIEAYVMEEIERK